MAPRRAALLLLLVAAALTVAAPAAAQGEGAEETPADANASPVDYAITILPVEKPAFAWDVKELSFPAGKRITLTYDHADAEAPHNLNVYEGLPEPLGTICCLTGEAGRESITFTMPPTGELKYRCDVHPEMQGVIKVGAFSVGGAAAKPDAAGGHTGVPALGVHFLAYWVGVIAFAVLFVVYGLTFFLFKYGESGATTDHMDRPGAHVASAGESRARSWLVIGVTIALVGGAAILAAAKMG